MLIVYIMSVALLYTGGFIGDFISKYEFLIRMTYYGYYLDSSLINDDVAANFGVVYKITFILCLVVYTKRKFFKSNGQILLFNLFLLVKYYTIYHPQILRFNVLLIFLISL